jgi:hypothetical protein
VKRKDPMPPGVWEQVVARDGGCVARLVDPDAGLCSDEYGNLRYRLEVDHVRPAAGAATISDPRWLVTLCPWHHRASVGGRIWATSHRPLLRAYLATA